MALIEFRGYDKEYESVALFMLDESYIASLYVSLAELTTKATQEVDSFYSDSPLYLLSNPH